MMASFMEYARATRRLDEIDRKLGKAAREETFLRKVSTHKISLLKPTKLVANSK